jgi:hypothetical protein
LQVADETPSHIVAPAIHRSRESIADLLNERFDPDPPLETAAELTRFAREHLGAQIEDAEVGLTGANFVTADTGTLALVTSEGNARKTMAATDTHVAVAGVEKIVPSVADLRPFVELIGRAPLSQGMVETARDHAERVADALGPAVADDRDVVVIEPSDHAMFQREYERLLDAETYDLLASDTYEILEYVSGLLENGASAEALRDGAGERVASGTSCLEQLAHLLDRPAAHPVELLVPGDGRGL